MMNDLMDNTNLIDSKKQADISRYIKSLQGISYFDWIKLKTAIDRSFKMQISELEKEIQLTNNTEQIERLIRSQFG